MIFGRLIISTRKEPYLSSKRKKKGNLSNFDCVEVELAAKAIIDVLGNLDYENNI